MDLVLAFFCACNPRLKITLLYKKAHSEVSGSSLAFFVAIFQLQLFGFITAKTTLNLPEEQHFELVDRSASRIL